MHCSLAWWGKYNQFRKNVLQRGGILHSLCFYPDRTLMSILVSFFFWHVTWNSADGNVSGVMTTSHPTLGCHPFPHCPQGLSQLPIPLADSILWASSGPLITVHPPLPLTRFLYSPHLKESSWWSSSSLWVTFFSTIVPDPFTEQQYCRISPFLVAESSSHAYF